MDRFKMSKRNMSDFMSLGRIRARGSHEEGASRRTSISGRVAADLPLPKHILTHGHWTMDRFKMSKSRGNVANPFEAG
jgi:hypothetical protein